MTRRTKLQSRAFSLLLLACVTAGVIETHLVVGTLVTAGLICTAGVLVYASNHEGR